MAESSCACGGGTLTLIFACSGAANVAKKTVERAGITKYAFVRVTDLGLEKGKTPVTEDAIAKAAAAGAQALSC